MSEDAFVKEAERLRRELLAYCYRLTGSVQDAEDLVQEATLHGWRSYARFRGEASVRIWLWRIATNAFLSSTRRRRHLPSDLGPPATRRLLPGARLREPRPSNWRSLTMAHVLRQRLCGRGARSSPPARLHEGRPRTSGIPVVYGRQAAGRSCTIRADWARLARATLSPSAISSSA